MKHTRIVMLLMMVVLACILLCACQGEQGAQGEQGVQGLQGEAGADGRTPEFRENNGWREWKYENDATTRFDFVLNADCESYSLVGISNMTSTTIEIPAEYNGKPVTKISSVSPMNYSGVKEVIIPPSVKEIGYQAFLNCVSLEKVVIPESVTVIGQDAFYMCFSLREIELNVEKIEAMTFYDCDKLEKVVLGNKTKIIGDQAFANCGSLKSIVFNEGLKEIGSAAFINCSKLGGEVKIPANVSKIGSCAFYNTSIEKLIFENADSWICYTEALGSTPAAKLDLSDETANAELAQTHIGSMYTWQKGIAVGVSGGIEPFASVTNMGLSRYQFEGFDIDLVKAIEAELEDMCCVFIYIDNFDESFAGIDNATYDIVISAMEYTSARAENYSTSTVYYTDGTSNYVIYGDKDDTALMAQINEALAKIMSGDEYAALKTKYGL